MYDRGSLTTSSETVPLLSSGRHKLRRAHVASTSYAQTLDSVEFERSVTMSMERSTDGKGHVGMKRHITLVDCIGIIVGNVIGSGIFISPKGVLENIGSVGATLIIWGAMGLYALAQAMCYAELGSVIPMAGGDYAYIFTILGAVPAFMCVWAQVVIVSASANAVISRTAALYLAQSLDLNCHDNVIMLMSILIIVSFAVLNVVSSRHATRVMVMFSAAKVIALSLIIIAGIVQLFKGFTYNFEPEHAFQGTSTNPGMIATAALDGYFAYKGWELVNTLPEEMVNPGRDLPLGLVIAMLLVTAIYVLTNMAYLTVLSPQQLLSSDAVALSFTSLALGRAASWIISISVAFSCMGTINGSFLGDTRYLFAAGRYKQMPSMFSMIQLKYLTPVASIIGVCVMSTFYSLIPGVESMQAYSSLAVQLKIILSLAAFFYLRWTKPDLPRPVKVPLPLAILVTLLMLGMIALGAYQDPWLIGMGILLFLIGLPVFYVTKFIRTTNVISRVMAKLTVIFQQLFLVVPECAPTSGGQESLT